MQIEFEQMQLAGMLPSLLTNKIGIPSKNLRLLLQKFRLLENGCWEWTGAKITDGYGVVKIRAIRDSIIQVHRLTYELANGKIPDGMQMHHQVENGCIGPSCGNPGHVRPVAPAEHVRDLTPASLAFINSRATECPKGHAYDIENTWVSKDGVRQCRQCWREKAQEQRDAKLEAEGREKFKWHAEHLKKECKRGHSLEDPANVYLFRGFRKCRACQSLLNQQCMERKKAKLTSL